MASEQYAAAAAAAIYTQPLAVLVPAGACWCQDGRGHCQSRAAKVNALSLSNWTATMIDPRALTSDTTTTTTTIQPRPFGSHPHLPTHIPAPSSRLVWSCAAQTRLLQSRPYRSACSSPFAPRSSTDPRDSRPFSPPNSNYSSTVQPATALLDLSEPPTASALPARLLTSAISRHVSVVVERGWGSLPRR